MCERLRVGESRVWNIQCARNTGRQEKGNQDEAGGADKSVLGRATHLYQELGLYPKGSGSTDGF